MVTFLEELKAKQQAVMGRIIDSGAQTMQGNLVAQVKIVASNIPGALVLEPPSSKNKADALIKINRDYKGDWLAIKDMARCTLVVRSPNEYDAAIRVLRAHFVASNGFSVIEQKTIQGHLNDGGYSGCTVFVSADGHNGEIQVNSPSMMYAQSLSAFRKSFGESQVTLMKATYPLVRGGLGHLLYENFRQQPGSPTGRAFMAASKLYFNYFRSTPPNRNWGLAAKEAIDKLPSLKHEPV